MHSSLAMLAATLACLLGATPAVEAQPSPPPLVDAPEHFSRLSVSFDVGVPYGLGASVGFRPLKWLRLHGGPATNGIAPGLAGGVSLIFLDGVFRPTIGASAGTFAEGDARRVVALLVPAAEQFAEPLSRVGYDYLSAQAGFELGSPRGASFLLRAGMSRTVVRVPAVAETFGEPAANDVAPYLTVLSPSVQLGLIVHFL